MNNAGEDEEYEEIDLPEGGGPADDGDGGDGDAGDLADVAEGEEDEEGNVVPVDASAPLTVTDVDNSRAVGRAHAGSVYALALAPGGGGGGGHDLLAATGGGDDVGRLWRVQPGGAALVELAVLGGHADSVVAVAVSRTGAFVATGAYDGTVRVHAAPSGAFLHALDGPGAEVEWVAWHPAADVLLAGSADGTAWMWGVTAAEATFMRVFSGHDADVTCGAFTPSGAAVVTGSVDASVRVWEPRTGKVAATFAGRGWADGPVTSLALGDGASPLVLAGAQDGTARLANGATKRVLGTLAHDPAVDSDATASVESVALDAAQPWAYTGGTDAGVGVWDLSTLSRREALTAAGGVVKLLALPGRALLAAATTVGCVELFDPRAAGGAAGGRAGRLSGHSGIVLDVAAAGDVVVTAGDDSSVRAFDLRAILSA